MSLLGVYRNVYAAKAERLSKTKPLAKVRFTHHRNKELYMRAHKSLIKEPEAGQKRAQTLEGWANFEQEFPLNILTILGEGTDFACIYVSISLVPNL